MLSALLCMILSTSACVKGPGVVYHQNYYHPMKKEILEKEVTGLEAAIDDHPGNSKKSASYFYLALLYAHYDNPSPDYHRSLGMFEKYLLFDPNNYKKDEAQYMMTLLQELVDTEKELSIIKIKTERMKQDSKKIKVKNKQLIVENQKLTDAIEKLKLLELSLEKKRLSFK